MGRGRGVKMAKMTNNWGKSTDLERKHDLINFSNVSSFFNDTFHHEIKFM